MRTWIIAALLAFALVAPSAWAAPSHAAGGGAMKRLLALLLLLPSLCFGAALDQSKIIAPSSGVYLGAYEWTAGDIAAVEAATGYTTSHYASQRGNWAIGYVSGHPHLDVTAANAAQWRIT